MSDRPFDQLRPISITRRFTATAAGSVLWKQGNTWVLCNASVSQDVPPWFKPDAAGGWITAEYTMLPASTPQRKPWPKTGHTDSRGTEIQRLIGRVLRAAIDLRRIGPHTITIDCHVLQADGGTRTASICGGMVALRDAVASLPASLDGVKGIKPDRLEANRPHYDPSKAIVETVAAVSVGYVGDQPHLDLDYPLDSKAGVDFNIAMTASGKFVELQGAGENGQCFTPDQLSTLLSLGRRGCELLFDTMRRA